MSWFLAEIRRGDSGLSVPRNSLVENYLSLLDGQPLLQIETVPTGTAVEETRACVERLQRGLDDQRPAFDLTGGTKAMTAGLVLACIDDPYTLQYYDQAPPARLIEAAERWRQRRSERGATGERAPDARAIAWGLLPIERAGERPLDQGGLLPVQVDLDVEVIKRHLDA